MTHRPHYTEDPLMVGPRKEHRLLLEDVGTGKTLFGSDTTHFGAGCAAGDWMDPRRYDYDGHAEGFDLHMQDVQSRVHRATEAARAGEDERPDDHPEA
ncbi:hypothetical protein ACFUC2_04795 [[Kitasatospora] papulosa]|uniref:hypothetical protein n=1 Tax=[Kitasatospora] papulosa TaxID=1464011 RepID=UPI003631584B